MNMMTVRVGGRPQDGHFWIRREICDRANPHLNPPLGGRREPFPSV